ncbi:hypothetical protein P152DRAFT_451198 [Eremomyces bilateralis CBS 781.70]|uniref:Alpha/beta-hydrolase n=1 Tax=Eremomyces bilateralis CBS 781.70 TaxID=1392243 RepID=A0A6G1FXZ0_9PEZI|nr:uncharacterized protein P152DRAFT_451198 [Eremomyces bilateralis CBS 781.70]KAF1810459.1 hypothetical protein P152DRAFT_451198 [Eremomyces bilateralis CBS 781.70]
MGLPKPSLTFTLPSLHDDTPLDCRIYQPKATLNGAFSNVAAILAHPYAPLGGCFDDPVLDAVGSELLENGWAVATFNFRGALGSHGRTSWTGKPEVADYITIAGFVIFYLQHLQVRQRGIQSPEEGVGLPPQVGNPESSDPNTIHLILGGYSYGSLIVTHLPTVSEIIARFSSPVEGSAAAEVRLRARRLAEEDAALYSASLPATNVDSSPCSPSKSRLLSIGGDETDAEHRRSLRELRRSIDGRPSHRSLDLPERIRSIRHKDKGNQTGPSTLASDGSDLQAGHMPNVVESYLLISPLLPPTSFFTAVSLRDPNLEKFSRHPTLAVFGDSDVFTSIRKLREWAAGRSQPDGSRFQGAAVNKGGHFWIDPAHVRELKEAVIRWAASIKQ